MVVQHRTRRRCAHGFSLCRVSGACHGSGLYLGTSAMLDICGDVVLNVNLPPTRNVVGHITQNGRVRDVCISSMDVCLVHAGHKNRANLCGRGVKSRVHRECR